MSEKHLSKGSVQPPKVDGQMRLYGMKYCPFTQRVKLVLNAYKIPHDVVHINLTDEPEWYSEISSKGNVPVLDCGSQLIEDSVKICKYLENIQPDHNNLTADDEVLIEEISELSSLWHKCVFKEVEKSLAEWGQEFSKRLAVLEKAMNDKNTKYFGGDKPGIVDYILWPFAERSSCVKMSLQEDLPLDTTAFSKLLQWRSDMLDDPVVKEQVIGSKKFWDVAKHKLEGTTPDYDLE